MQAQITAEREKRALIASSEGRKQEQINIATGAREAEIARSEGEKQAQINIAQGEAGAVLAVAEATARAIQMVAESVRQPGGMEAVNLRVADRYVDAFGNLAKTNNTLIIPANLADVGGLIAAAMSVIKSQQVQKA
jgi:regulator of protease activity HflC (stomatin/prohibitin superfamily)